MVMFGGICSLYYLDNIMTIFIIKGTSLLRLNYVLPHGHVCPTSLSFFKGWGTTQFLLILEHDALRV